MPQHYWMVKEEPGAFSWAQFLEKGAAAWTGIRNFQARNYLRSMGAGDWVLYYHSGSERQIVGLAKVAKTAYPDTTANDGDWSAVDLTPIKSLARPVPLQVLKDDTVLREMPMIKQARLSVAPLTRAQFQRVLTLAKTPAPRPPGRMRPKEHREDPVKSPSAYATL